MTKKTDSPIYPEFPQITADSHPRLTGNQIPAVDICESLKDADFTHGWAAIELSRRLGLVLMPWQRREVLLALARVQVDGQWLWLHNSYCLVCPRQNGKSAVAEAVLTYLFFRLRMRVIFTAHRWTTSKEIFERMWQRYNSRKWLLNKIQRKTCSQGIAEIILRPKKEDGDKQVKLQFSTRSGDAGRGFTSVDLVIYDEAFNLDDGATGALAPIQQAANDPMSMYLSSAVNADEHTKGMYLSEVRGDVLSGESDSMRYVEFAAPKGMKFTDPHAWRLANPAYGVIGNDRKMKKLRREMKKDSVFSAEMLGWGNWYLSESESFKPIMAIDEWHKHFNDSPVPLGDCSVAVDVAPDSGSAALVAALKVDGGIFLSLSEVKDFDRQKLVDAVVSAVEKNDPLGPVVDQRGPAGTLLQPLEDAGIEADVIKFTDIKAGLELMLAMFREGKLQHDGDERWVEALSSAQFREVSGGRLLRSTDGPICPLVAASCAIWRLMKDVETKEVQTRTTTARGLYAAAVPMENPALAMNF